MPLTRLARNQRLRWDRQLCQPRSDSTMQHMWCIVQFKEIIAVIEMTPIIAPQNYAGTNLYPSPRTVTNNAGFFGSRSSFCRMLATCTSTVRVNAAEL